MRSIKPANFGLIIRTNAEHKRVAELDADLKALLGRWDTCYRNLRNAAPPSGCWADRPDQRRVCAMC